MEINHLLIEGHLSLELKYWQHTLYNQWAPPVGQSCRVQRQPQIIQLHVPSLVEEVKSGRPDSKPGVQVCECIV